MEFIFGLVVFILGIFMLGGIIGSIEAAKQKAQAKSFADALEAAWNEMRTGEKSATLPVLSTSEAGYRPVGGENLIALQEGVSRREMRSTGKYSTSGGSISIPLGGGVRYRVGTGSIRTEKAMTTVATGRLLLTDKAVAFESREGNTRLTWGQIADLNIARDGVVFHRRNGKPLIFATDSLDPKFAAAALLLRDRV